MGGHVGLPGALLHEFEHGYAETEPVSAQGSISVAGIWEYCWRSSGSSKRRPDRIRRRLSHALGTRAADGERGGDLISSGTWTKNGTGM